MLTVALADELRLAGLLWTPAPGDRFVLPDRGMDHEVFHLSDMTVEVHEMPRGGRVLGFNGTTEWALDAVQLPDALWLPTEGQLRELLGARFRRLEAPNGGPASRHCAVVVDEDGAEQSYESADAECAYARALLAALRSRTARGA
ncbi:MAG: pilus assembly protein CpaE [Actinomycetota bacterium]|nr:pilus assembly protein CpaE [Actinomycetota bacterium]